MVNHANIYTTEMTNIDNFPFFGQLSCVHDMLQTSRVAFNLNQSLSAIEKLLHFDKI